MNKENVKIHKKEVHSISMPTMLKIGDPMYFESYGDDFKYVYSKNFRGRKKWLGELIVLEKEDLDFKKETGFDFKEVSFKVIFAPSQEYLTTFREGLFYKGQKEVVTEIGVDTAEYIIETNSGYIDIGTGSDGLMGVVIEFYKGSKLEGIVIDLTAMDVNIFERIKDELLYVFNKA